MGEHVQLRTVQDGALPALVVLWNEAAAGRRNARPVTESEFRRRVLECPAFDASGLILAWSRQGDRERLVGFVHAFKPPRQEGLYRRWEQIHHLGPLYVSPAARRQGTGARLLQAAESYLYYCPVHVMSESLPAYGAVEGPRAPFWGAGERMGVGTGDHDLIQFLRKRSYRVTDPGSVSMRIELGEAQAHPNPLALEGSGLSRVFFSDGTPLVADEPVERRYYSLLGANGGSPYAGIALVDGAGQVAGHIGWYPLRTDHAAITNFRVLPALRGRGLGRFLLDDALHALATLPAPHGGFRSAELYTHVVRNAAAVALYEQHGFEIDAAWVSLVKT